MVFHKENFKNSFIHTRSRTLPLPIFLEEFKPFITWLCEKREDNGILRK